ncbi:MAG TPA: hypothetical protein VM243_08340 [Phycisphaerae bacterium]|nr:hypothetical protein [Phycisphaerae bacterium]
MAGAQRVRVEAGRNGSIVVIRPGGPCTVAICGAVLNFLKKICVAETSDIYFDLSRAQGIDSTFTGFLVALVTTESDSPIPAIHLLAPSKPVVTALERMFVLGLFDVVEEMAQSPADWQEVEPAPVSPDGLSDLVIQAHQELINADQRNAPAFRTLVATLRASQKRKSDRS